MKKRMGACVGLPLALLAFLTGGAAAVQQADLVQRILADADARVRLEYRVRPGVELCRQGGIRMHRDGRQIESGSVRDADGCSAGPAVLRLAVRDGRLRSVELDGARWAPGPEGSERALGRVEASAAARALLTLATEAARAETAEDAVVAAVVADSATVWPELLEMARRAELDRELRTTAIFWAGQIAAERAASELEEFVRLDDAELAVREAAVFALAQLPPRDAADALMATARAAPHPRLRQSAFFWLAQSDDPRVADFFEEILAGETPPGI